MKEKTSSSAVLRRFFPSPFGIMAIEADNAGIVCLHFPETARGLEESKGSNILLESGISQLQEYFRGERKIFDLPLRPCGSIFQRSVWEVLCTIPYGVIWSYSEVAEAIGKPSARRAAGQAIGKNPLPILIPCHRVIGKSGALTGFSAGLERKRRLLEIEKSTDFRFFQ